MDWKAKVDLFEQLRREREFGIGTIAGVAPKFGFHRRVVRRAIASALPPLHHYPDRGSWRRSSAPIKPVPAAWSASLRMRTFSAAVKIRR